MTAPTGPAANPPITPPVMKPAGSWGGTALGGAVSGASARAAALMPTNPIVQTTLALAVFMTAPHFEVRRLSGDDPRRLVGAIWRRHRADC